MPPRYNLSYPQSRKKDLEGFISKLSLQIEEVELAITQSDVRIFHFPTNVSKQEKTKIQKRLAEHPQVRRVGSIVHLGKQFVSFLTSEFVVKFREKIDDDVLAEISNKFNLKVIRALPYSQNSYVFRAKGTASYDSLKKVNKLSQESLVESIEPNLITTTINDFTPNDFLFGDQPHHQIINSEDAWEVTLGDKDIIITVVDSGWV